MFEFSIQYVISNVYNFEYLKSGTLLDTRVRSHGVLLIFDNCKDFNIFARTYNFDKLDFILTDCINY